MVQRNNNHKKTLNRQRFIPVLIFLFLSAPFSKYEHLSALTSFGLMLTLSVLWVLLYPKYFFSYAARKAKKELKKNPYIVGDYEYTLSKDTFTGKTEIGKETIKWSDIQAFEEDAKCFYLFKTAYAAYIIPKRDVADTEKVRDFIEKKTS
jgi:hypothetical protein